MKIISWNVNGIRAIQRKGAFDELMKLGSDLFFLQETKAHPDQLDDKVRSPAQYHSYFDHSKIKKGYSGVAMYSKTKPDKVIEGLGIEEFDQEGRTIGGIFGKTIILGCYFPNGGGGPVRLDYKMRYYDAFLKFVDKKVKAGFSVIFCGDVNTAHNEIDLARPKENEKNTGFLPTERAWLDKVVTHGYVDIWRVQNPEKTEYTWWDMKTMARSRNIGWRIDYFFVSKDLENKVEKAGILTSFQGSDHCPILLDVKI